MISTVHLYAAGTGVNTVMEEIFNKSGNSVYNYGYVDQGSLTQAMKTDSQNDARNKYGNDNDVLVTYSNGALAGQNVVKNMTDNINSLEGVVIISGWIGDKETKTVLNSGTNMTFICSTSNLTQNSKGSWKKVVEKNKFEYAAGQDRDTLNKAQTIIKNEGYELTSEREVECPSIVRKSKTLPYEDNGTQVAHERTYICEGKGDITIVTMDYCGHDDMGANGALYLTNGNK